MAIFDITKIEDIKSLKFNGAILIKVGDLVKHKPFEFYIIEGELKKEFPQIELFPATIGTDIYATHGHNNSVVSKI